MNFPCGDLSCIAPPAEVVGAGGGGVICVEGTVSLPAGEFDAAGFGVALGVICGTGVALGTSNRPRRSEAVGKADADEIAVAVATGVADCSAATDLRGVIIGLGVDVAIGDGVCVADMVADGEGVAAMDVDVVEVSPA